MTPPEAIKTVDELWADLRAAVKDRDEAQVHAAALEGLVNKVNAILEKAHGRNACVGQNTVDLLCLVAAQRDRARQDAAELRGSMKTLKEDKERLHEIIAKSENLKELERLRVEVSSLHRQVDSIGKVRDDYATEVRVARRLQESAQIRFRQLEGTAEQMQHARDAAQNHEAVALRALEEEKAARIRVEEGMAVKEDQLRILEAWHETVVGVHRKGHPEPVDGCKLCSLVHPPKTAEKVEAKP